MKQIFIVIALILLISYDLYAQVKPSISQEKLTVKETEMLKKHFKNYKTFTIDKHEILDSLKNRGKCRVKLSIDNVNDWLIDLRLNDMRADNFIATYTSESGTFQYKEFKPNTYKGITTDKKIARFTIDQDEFWGIIINNEKQILIRQIKDYTKNPKDESLILFEKSDLIIPMDNSDVVTDALMVPTESINPKNTLKAALCTYYLQIATEADFEFYQDMGSNLANTYSYIFSVLNIIEGVYESTFHLKFIVTFQNVWTTSSDPYSNTTDAGTLLNEFRTEWNTNRTGIARDIAHLFTGRDYSGWGIAWLGSLGTSYAYSSGEFRTEMYETTAHEIGHNLNAHDANLLNPVPAECLCGGETASVMCQGLKANNLWFCQTSINEINPYLSNNSNRLTANFTDNLTLSGTATGFNEYQARINISSTQTISNGFTIYKTNEADLNANFQVNAGAEFEIINNDNGCE